MSYLNKLLLAGTATIAFASPAAAAVIAGPFLENLESNWQYSGLEFQAQQNATLVSVVFQNQGLADTLVLTDTSGNILQSLATPSGSASYLANLGWSLSSGTTYRLLRTTATNTLYADFGAALPGNADIQITKSGIFTNTIGDISSFGANEYWSSFNDITTSSSGGGVPEPGSWALMLVGFGLVGAAMRRKTKVRFAFA